jgi:hypothetical protein
MLTGSLQGHEARDELDCPARSSSEVLEDNGIEDAEAEGGEERLKKGSWARAPRVAALMQNDRKLKRRKSVRR